MKIISTIVCRCVLATAVFAGSMVNVAFAFDWRNIDNWETVTVDEVQAWIKAGADLSARDESDRTPLHLAAWNNTNPAAISAALIKAGADVGATDYADWTPLHSWASFNQNSAAIPVLVEAGADVSARTDGGSSPLHSAAASGRSPAVISALIEAGADINAKTNYGSTPLHSAATNFYEETAIISALVAHGANLNSKNNSGKTPLELAHALGHTTTVEYLSDPARVKRDAEEYLRSIKE